MLLTQLLAESISFHLIHVVLEVDLLVSCSNQIVLVSLAKLFQEETRPKSQMAEARQLF